MKHAEGVHSCDSVARAVGADQVADAIQAEAARRQLPVDIQRTSSRGLYWLEPLLECESSEGRQGFGPVSPADVPSLLDALAGEPGGHSLALGPVEAIPYLKTQQRLLFARAGITRPLSLDDYRAHGGFKGLETAVAMDGAAVVATVLDSGLRGRGGAAFPAGIKWRTVREASAAQKYVVCNADEGDSGTFADRMLMEGDPFLLIEGMIIAGLAVGADKGYLYVRSEYPDAIRVLNQAFAIARDAGYLGGDVAGSGQAFDLEVRVGPVPISAVRKPRCSNPSKAGAASSAPSRRYPRSKACSACRPWCTTCLPWPRCRPSWPRARRSTAISAWAARLAPCRSSWPATSATVAWWSALSA